MKFQIFSVSNFQRLLRQRADLRSTEQLEGAADGQWFLMDAANLLGVGAADHAAAPGADRRGAAEGRGGGEGARGGGKAGAGAGAGASRAVRRLKGGVETVVWCGVVWYYAVYGVDCLFVGVQGAIYVGAGELMIDDW